MGLARKAALATAIGTEKARSEMIVADVTRRTSRALRSQHQPVLWD